MSLGFWQRAAVYATSAVVALSGVLWFVVHDVAWHGPGELAHWLLVLHGASSFAAMLVLGSLLPLHVRLGWFQRRNLASGMLLAAIATVLIVSGLVLYYGAEESRAVGRWVHIVAGLLGFAIVPVHVVLGRRSARRRRSALQSCGPDGGE